ncbi:hypothetical protein BH11CYA1_BH11CYA1_40910 [soil metagenome]
MPYQTIDDVAYGSAKLEIAEVVQKLPEFFANLAIIVTHLDSTPALMCQDREYLRTEHGVACKEIGQALLIEADSVSKYLYNCLSGGFDEFYLVKEPCQLKTFPTQKTFTTPPYFASELSPVFLETFKQIAAVGYLSDGIGLNYACDPKFAPILENMPDLETYHLRVLPYKLDRSGPFDPQIIGPIDIRKKSISL